jgi:type III restriction enzyme
MQLKTYQQNALETLRTYFRECVRLQDADTAFYRVTKEVFGMGVPYRPVGQLPGLPYACVRVPTGGGKTFMACFAAGIAAKELLHADRCVVLWLVPSNAIREQTLAALRDRRHPYRQTLDEQFGAVSVFNASEALSVSRPTLDGETAVVVATLQAFRVEETEGRKVYEPSGALMGHFTGLPPEIVATLNRYEDGAPIPSLENVLRIRRPIVIVDEAHNARTELSFDTLARFNPSCIVEFTATPATGANASNVLHSVSAAQLQAEDMIKMPIRLETRGDWKEVIADAIATLGQLEQAARLEQQTTGEAIRPIMLLQAQPRRKSQPTVTTDVVKDCLIGDHNIPARQIALATGSEWELDGVDLTAPDGPKFIITVQALREGWDCPTAYVLCSVAESRSETAVEQLLGRVLRMPRAQRKQRAELNMAYAFVASQSFADVANTLTDALVDNGFNKQEARDFITQAAPPSFEALPLFARNKVEEKVAEAPRFEYLPGELKGRVVFDKDSSTVIFTGEMGEAERDALKACFDTAEDKASVDRLYRRSHGYAVSTAVTASPAERSAPFSIPVLAIRQDSLIEAFEATHFLDLGWSLAECDAALTEAEFASQRTGGQRGEIAISKEGKVEARYIGDLQQQMALIADDRWNAGELLYWLERNIEHQDLEPDDFARFAQRLVRHLTDARGLSLEFLVHNKYRLRAAVMDKINQYRRAAHLRNFQTLLLPSARTPIVVSNDVRHVFDPARLPPYQSLYQGAYQFKKHYYARAGDLQSSGEEFECAQFLDTWDAVEFWVRNPVKTPLGFSLQTSTDKFYPDFACQLNDGRYLVVEYKNATDWSNDENTEKRDLGELWEARSNGACLFVMPKGKDFDAIRAKVVRR